MLKRFSSLSKLNEAYTKNPHLKELVQQLKDITNGQRPSSAPELYKLMNNEKVQQISTELQRELAKENIELMDILTELRAKQK